MAYPHHYHKLWQGIFTYSADYQYFIKNIIIWDPLLDLNVQQVKVKVEFCTTTQLGVNLLSTLSLP